jgi:hypothetical protein
MILIGKPVSTFPGSSSPASQHPPFGGVMGVQISGSGCPNFVRMISLQDG